MDNSNDVDQALWAELVEHGILDAGSAKAMRKLVEEAPRVPLGKVLIREGYLSVRQVMALLSIQAIEPQLRIGDLAVRERACTPDQVNAALEIQAQSSPGPIELLAKDKSIDNGDLIDALVGYIHHLEGRVSSLSRGITEAALPCLS